MLVTIVIRFAAMFPLITLPTDLSALENRNWPIDRSGGESS
jgi:hypothetical protein